MVPLAVVDGDFTDDVVARRVFARHPDVERQAGVGPDAVFHVEAAEQRSHRRDAEVVVEVVVGAVALVTPQDDPPAGSGGADPALKRPVLAQHVDAVAVRQGGGGGLLEVARTGEAEVAGHIADVAAEQLVVHDAGDLVVGLRDAPDTDVE